LVGIVKHCKEKFWDRQTQQDVNLGDNIIRTMRRSPRNKPTRATFTQKLSEPIFVTPILYAAADERDFAPPAQHIGKRCLTRICTRILKIMAAPKKSRVCISSSWSSC